MREHALHKQHIAYPDGSIFSYIELAKIGKKHIELKQELGFLEMKILGYQMELRRNEIEDPFVDKTQAEIARILESFM